MHWNKVTLVGVGLLGGSLGLALKRRRLADSVVGFVRRAPSVKECKRLGAVDFATQDLLKAVKDADFDRVVGLRERGGAGTGQRHRGGERLESEATLHEKAPRVSETPE